MAGAPQDRTNRRPASAAARRAQEEARLQQLAEELEASLIRCEQKFGECWVRTGRQTAEQT